MIGGGGAVFGSIHIRDRGPSYIPNFSDQQGQRQEQKGFMFVYNFNGSKVGGGVFQPLSPPAYALFVIQVPLGIVMTCMRSRSA